MIKNNVIIIYDKNEENILMCKRKKEPYKGLYNLVGGKLEINENDLAGAYRELEEETGITCNDTILYHMMDFKYYLDDLELQVYIGKLNKDMKLSEEENKLFWIKKNEDFFDSSIYAGEGNIGHMLEHIEKNKENVWKE